ncbi:hypothetical protein SAMN04488544_1276 [Microlunatus sagamiharensis]|uniref:Uncharacterized protein n=1 Tax=Microlunatus sagamiharensis TaxID=546874 RepID=A0A1H2M2D6_9ACTN|nr:hypothetical protein [Microlunatus sagamiharensis]SDU87339.1 hypothetical protein SAMN04488544_1276 [Microlunatus sagamiharensis]
MQRSRSQVLFSFLPQAVFRHEDRLFGQVSTVDGTRVSALNESVVYEEISAYLQMWDDDARLDLPLPTVDRRREYTILSPETVRWEVYPLVFECTRRSCGRVRSFREARDIVRSPRCSHCGGGLRQLRFYNAHNCGRTQPLFVAKCSTHGWDHITFDDTGSFTTATWRCRGQGCNNAVVRQTNQSPCTCERYPGADGVVRMRAHTLDDSRAYTPHYIDLVNIDSSVFQDYQKHPSRAQIALAHHLGLISSIREGITQANASSGGTRSSPAEWAAKEAMYREMGLGDSEIAVLRASSGPADSGLAAVDVSQAVLDTVAGRRQVYERAAVYDPNEVQRFTLADQRASAAARNDPAVVQVLDKAETLAKTMGLAEVAVSWEFPIAKVVFGYTRESPVPGDSNLRGFRHQAHHEGKHPVYAVETETEAVLVTLDALAVCDFLVSRGELASLPATEEDAKRKLLEVFAIADADPVPAATVTALVHTLSHLMLLGLDDGQVGFSESSLAEWLVPETLTFAVYANSLKEFTLGALWTLLSSRAAAWLSGVVTRSVRCENDPLCYQENPRACERCTFITFGCPEFNADLDRRVLSSFFQHRGVLAAI